MSTAELPNNLGLINTNKALTLSIWCAGLYVVVNIISAIYSAYFGPLSKYPGPKWLALSQWHRFRTLRNGIDGKEYLRLHRQYGPIVRISPNMLSYASGAQAWKDIEGFKKPGQPKMYKDPEFYTQPFNGVPGIITADDATHSRQRKAVTHAFADKSLRELEPMLKEWAWKMKTKLQEQATAGKQVDILKYYNCTTFDIMADLSFNEGLDMLDNGEYSHWVKAIFLGIKEAAMLRAIKLTSAVGRYFVDRFLMNTEMVRVKSVEHWNYSKERVDRRLKKNPERPDLWTKILQKSEGPGGFTIDEHHSIASIFMIAGTETTATALSGTTYYLLKNPQYMAKLTKEVRDTYSSFDDIGLDSLARLKYLQAVLQEGLRMYPPVPGHLPRVVPKGGAIICGEFVPEGTKVAIHQLSSYRNESNFKNASDFRPERWLGDPEYKDDRLDAVEPFTIGPRNCLGKNLAWLELRLLLATTLLHFDLSLADDCQDWADQLIYILWEKIPLNIRLTPVKP